MAIKKLEKVSTPKTVNWFASREDLIRFDLSIQRNHVWKNEQKSLLIHSLLYGYPMPPLYSLDKGDGVYWILDGKQRLTTIIDFINGRFKLDENTPDVFGELIADKYFNELTEDMQKELKGLNLMIFHFKNINQAEIEEMFYRLNNGSPLSRIETTRAMSGSLISILDKYLEKDLFKNRLQMNGKSRNRFKDTEVLIQSMIVIDSEFNFNGLGSKEIERFILEKKNSSLNDSMLNRFNDLIKFVENASENFTKKELKMFKKSNLPIILKVASEVKNSDLSENEFGKKLVEFFIENYDGLSEYGLLNKAGTSQKENIIRRTELLKNYITLNLNKMVAAV